jgi:hypothetical protein
MEPEKLGWNSEMKLQTVSIEKLDLIDGLHSFPESSSPLCRNLETVLQIKSQRDSTTHDPEALSVAIL